MRTEPDNLAWGDGLTERLMGFRACLRDLIEVDLSDGQRLELFTRMLDDWKLGARAPEWEKRG